MLIVYFSFIEGNIQGNIRSRNVHRQIHNSCEISQAKNLGVVAVHGQFTYFLKEGS